MKLNKYIYGIALGTLSLVLASCYNKDKDFPGYEKGTTAYFAYQNPVRTLVLGNDIYDNSLDNALMAEIKKLDDKDKEKLLKTIKLWT